jgi:PTS system mannitol-specific IIC component
MGSSAMGASVLKNRLKKSQIEGVEVKNTSISNIPQEVDLIITHFDLMKRAKSSVNRDDVSFMGILNFVEATEYDEIIQQVKTSNS